MTSVKSLESIAFVLQYTATDLFQCDGKIEYHRASGSTLYPSRNERILESKILNILVADVSRRTIATD